MSRLMIFTWDLPGRCNIRAMNYAINAHLRRHDTYHSGLSSTMPNTSFGIPSLTLQISKSSKLSIRT
ncbi:polyketide synthase [Mycobacterium tuberculosis]|nr:polyketide synthase [Mycobacterium tuberculosis]CKU36425.1 polyketide synthase [Mycobacterium tuberculosis]